MNITKHQYTAINAAMEAWNAAQEADEECRYPRHAMSIYICTGENGEDGSFGDPAWEEGTQIHASISVWRSGDPWRAARALTEILQAHGLPVSSQFDAEGSEEDGKACFGYEFTPTPEFNYSKILADLTADLTACIEYWREETGLASAVRFDPETGRIDDDGKIVAVDYDAFLSFCGDFSIEAVTAGETSAAVAQKYIDLFEAELMANLKEEFYAAHP